MSASSIHFIRRGAGKPILLVHGLGGSWRSWNPILDSLAAHRDVIAIDLPGFGNSAPLKEVTISSLAGAVTAFIRENGLTGIDIVGSSMGARLVLELARRGGIVGAVVSLDPGGFWQGWERHALYLSLSASILALRALQDQMPLITRTSLGRRILFAQLSAQPEKIPAELALDEMRSYINSPSFDEMLYNLVYGEDQLGSTKGSINKPLIIAWGLNDHVCFPGQAQRAMDLFEDARLYWFKNCGHFPHWDAPQETLQLILNVTGDDEKSLSRRKL